jgi:hypothetical protein
LIMHMRPLQALFTGKGIRHPSNSRFLGLQAFLARRNGGTLLRPRNRGVT